MQPVDDESTRQPTTRSRRRKIGLILLRCMLAAVLTLSSSYAYWLWNYSTAGVASAHYARLRHLEIALAVAVASGFCLIFTLENGRNRS
jgi:O-antigen ligase